MSDNGGELSLAEDVAAVGVWALRFPDVLRLPAVTNPVALRLARFRDPGPILSVLVLTRPNTISLFQVIVPLAGRFKPAAVRKFTVR